METMSLILAILLLLVTLQSSFYFLKVKKAGLVKWIVFNACAPSNFAFLIGFAIYLLFGDRTLLHTAILPMFFFGGLGLFLFPWRGMFIIPQIGHLIMLANIAWTALATFQTHDYLAATVGLLLGILIFVPFIGFQQHYVAKHPEDFKRLLILKNIKRG